MADDVHDNDFVAVHFGAISVAMVDAVRFLAYAVASDTDFLAVLLFRKCCYVLKCLLPSGDGPTAE